MASASRDSGTPLRRAVATPPDQETIHVELSEAEARETRTEWDRNAFERLKTIALWETDRERKARLGMGYRHTDGASYDADAQAQRSVLLVATMIASGHGLPGGRDTIGWWDTGNVVHEMAEAEFLALAAGMRDWSLGISRIARDKKNAIGKRRTLASLKRHLAANPIKDGWDRAIRHE